MTKYTYKELRVFKKLKKINSLRSETLKKWKY